MRRLVSKFAATAAICLAAAPMSLCADVFTLEGPVRTNLFRQANFKWMVSPRHDYSKTYVTKLSPTAKAWTIDAKGRTEFTKFTIDGDTVTITLAPNEMVLLSSRM